MSIPCKRTKLKYISMFLVGVCTASISAMLHADWSIKGLGNLGGSGSTVSAMNDSGQIAGNFIINDNYQALITGPNGMGTTEIGTLGGDYSFARAINNSGQVAGQSPITTDDFDSIFSHAFITGSDGKNITDVGNVGVNGEVFSINDSGQIVGDLDLLNVNGFHAFITGSNGIGITDLGTLGGVHSSATGINNSGQVVGWAQTGNSGNALVDSHAFITGPNGVGMTDLGTLNGNFSVANSINNSGQVVGNVGEQSDIYYHHAFITGPDGTGMINLGTLGGYFSDALSINNAGEAVGWATTANGDFHAFIYSHGGITDLSLLDVVSADGWRSISVIDINNNGQILGMGINSLNVSEAFILSYTPDTVFTPNPIFIPPPPPPIPEPETYFMLLAGLGLLGFVAQRRRRMAI